MKMRFKPQKPMKLPAEKKLKVKRKKPVQWSAADGAFEMQEGGAI